MAFAIARGHRPLVIPDAAKRRSLLVIPAEAESRDGGAYPMIVPEAASAAIRGKGQEVERAAALLPAQPCGLSGRVRWVARPVPALRFASDGMTRGFSSPAWGRWPKGPEGAGPTLCTKRTKSERRD